MEMERRGEQSISLSNTVNHDKLVTLIIIALGMV